MDASKTPQWRMAPPAYQHQHTHGSGGRARTDRDRTGAHARWFRSNMKGKCLHDIRWVSIDLNKPLIIGSFLLFFVLYWFSQLCHVCTRNNVDRRGVMERAKCLVTGMQVSCKCHSSALERWTRANQHLRPGSV